MTRMAMVLACIAFPKSYSTERSGDDKMQVTLSGRAYMQVLSGQRVRQTTKESGSEQKHVEVAMMKKDAQKPSGLVLVVILLSMSAMLAFILYRSDLCAMNTKSDKAEEYPTFTTWGALVASAETTVGIMKNLIGAGILCLPIAASEMSIVGAIVGMSFCCLCSLSSFLLIGFACDRFNASSYGELMAAAFGNLHGHEWVGSRMNVVLLVHTLGGCIAYMTIIADVSVKLVQDSFHMSDLSLRFLCVVSLTIFLLLPLCLHDRLKSLSITSWLGVTAMTFVAGFCVRDCIADWGTAKSVEIVKAHLLTFKGTFFKAIPLINGAYIVHYNAPTFFSETEGRSLTLYGTSALLAHLAVSVLYLTVAFAGFARFGDAVHGNLLTSYENSGHSWVLTCWVCVLLNMVFTLPLLFQRSRQSLILIIEQYFTADSSISSQAHQACAGSGEQPSTTTDQYSNAISLYYGLTIGILALLVVCGTVFRHLDTIMMVREATIGVLLMYVLPPLACFRLLSESQESVSEGHSDSYRRYLCWILLLAGVGSSCAAFAAVILQSL